MQLCLLTLYIYCCLRDYIKIEMNGNKHSAQSFKKKRRKLQYPMLYELLILLS